MPVTPSVDPPAAHPTTPLPLAVAASLAGVEAMVLLGLGVLEVAHVRSIRLTMGVTTSVFFLAAAAALAWCAWSLWTVRRWARGPVVMTQLIQLGLAWNLWTGSTKLASVVLALVALVVVVGLVHPDSTRALEAGEADEAGS